MKEVDKADRRPRLPLHAEHRSLGAKMGDFAGWEMPIRYTSTIQEHLQVRREAGLFDISHMGRVSISSEDVLGESLEAVDRLVGENISRLPVGRAAYTLLLNETGGIKDDLVIYRTENGLLLILNAARTQAGKRWLGAHLPSAAGIDDLTLSTCLFALQGPEAFALLSALGEGSAGEMGPFTHKQVELGGIAVHLMRTGYTGEQGVELMVSREEALDLWRMILEVPSPAEAHPCGLGARDTLRLEAGLLLHGRDITEDIDPFSARLNRFVDLDRPSFMGREALLRIREKGPDRLLAGLTTEARAIPRSGDLLYADPQEPGRVTSGAYSPVLRRPIALGYVPPDKAVPRTRLTVRSRRREIPVEVTELPFYRRGKTPVPEGER